MERDGLPPVLLRSETTSMRRCKGQAPYWPRMYSMALTIAKLLMDKQQVMARFVEYREVSIITHHAALSQRFATRSDSLLGIRSQANGE